MKLTLDLSISPEAMFQMMYSNSFPGSWQGQTNEMMHLT